MRTASITGWGHYVPERVVTNDELSEYMDTSDEWIRSRSGIRERRFAAENETTATMSVESGRRALRCAEVAPEAVDLLLVASSSPDYLTPPVSSQVQEGLGLPTNGAMQLTVGCTGFVYALVTAQQFIETGACDTVLVIGTELVSRWLSWNKRSTAVLFGDGSGAVVMQATQTGGMRSHVLGSDGAGAENIIVPTGGVAEPITHAHVANNEPTLEMNGREVFKFATRILGRAVTEALQASPYTVNDIDLLVPHQANARIIQYAADALGLSDDQVFMNVDRYGNTSAASVPLALSEALDAGRAAPGDTLALVAFGAGLTWAATILDLPESLPTPVAKRAAHPSVAGTVA
ncbi:MAG: beta-ketoacyl-ACP synthase III [Longimonas sp.]|uniref:beta-ketoacyl-ACP synthase III n=1 Tax=Longimonas sp. TaxID=2039626 RepID=UPI003974B138